MIEKFKEVIRFPFEWITAGLTACYARLVQLDDKRISIPLLCFCATLVLFVSNFVWALL